MIGLYIVLFFWMSFRGGDFFQLHWMLHFNLPEPIVGPVHVAVGSAIRLIILGKNVSKILHLDKILRSMKAQLD